jgi:hypothetical protein
MEQEGKRTLAYLCPHCHQSVIADRTAFELTAAPLEIPCPCGKSYLRVEYEGTRFRLTVPCLSCGKEHTVVCASDAFLEQKALAFSCSASGLDCCYVGEEGPVFAATRRLEEAADRLERAKGEESQFLDELVMHEVLDEVKEIAQRGGISCECGSKRWRLQINYSSIDLICADCGAAMRIPAATASDIEDICCKPTILIQKTGKRDHA